MSKEFKSVLCDSVPQVMNWYKKTEQELREAETALKEAFAELEKQKKAAHETQQDGYSVHLIKAIEKFKKVAQKVN